MAILDWTKQEIGNWQNFKNVISALASGKISSFSSKPASDLTYILFEMQIIEEVVAYQLGFSLATIDRKTNSIIEYLAKEKVNLAVTGGPESRIAKRHLTVIQGILEAADKLIQANNLESKYYTEAKLVFSYLRGDNSIIEAINFNSKQWVVFQNLLKIVIDNAESLDIKVTRHIRLQSRINFARLMPANNYTPALNNVHKRPVRNLSSNKEKVYLNRVKLKS